VNAKFGSCRQKSNVLLSNNGSHKCHDWVVTSEIGRGENVLSDKCVDNAAPQIWPNTDLHYIFVQIPKTWYDRNSNPVQCSATVLMHGNSQ
jgi:hypothetical protein